MPIVASKPKTEAPQVWAPLVYLATPLHDKPHISGGRLCRGHQTHKIAAKDLSDLRGLHECDVVSLQ